MGTLNRYRPYLSVAALCLAIACAQRDGDMLRNNPFDPNGTDWRIDSKPVLTAAIDSLPLWTDFNFKDSTGTVLGLVSAKDYNAPRDTVRLSLLLGTSDGALDTVSFTKAGDTALIANLRRSTTYYYKFIATDSWDSSTIVTGRFSTPIGSPPAVVDSVFVLSDTLNTIIIWYGIKTSITYRLYRSTQVSGPFRCIFDTVPVNSPYTYVAVPDFVPDYNTYFYLVGAANQYGECKTKKVASGSRYDKYLSVPYSVSASRGSYPDRICISWYVSYSAPKYFIHRSLLASGPYAIIDSTSQTTYYDYMRDTNSAFYYRISLRNSSGHRSKLSDSAYGYCTMLSAPGGLSATNGTYDNYILLSWYYVSSASNYKIFRSLSYTGPYELIGTTASTTYRDSVTTWDTYYYKVAACSNTGRTGFQSSYVAGSAKRLAAPSSVSASQGTLENAILVTWSSVANAAGYYLYRSKGVNTADSLKLLDSTASIGATALVDSVFTSDNYYYAVVSRDTYNRQSLKSSTVLGYSKRLATPSISSASNGLYYQYILVQWSAVADAAGYYVYRSDNGSGGPFTVIDTVQTTAYADSSIYSDTASTSVKYFYYRIAAYSANGKTSATSSSVAGYLKILSYPVNIAASIYEYKTHIALSWDSVPGATAYSVYRSTSSSGFYAKVATVSACRYNDSAVAGSTCLCYKISSVKGSSETVQSSWVQGCRLSPPANFTATGYSGYILLGWTTYSNILIKGYYLYRSTDNINFVRIAILNSNATSSYRDSVVDNRIYYYKISTFSSSQESDFSSIISCQKRPDAPTGLKSVAYPTYIALSWDSVPLATRYNVYRKIASTGYEELLIGTSKTNYNDSTAVPGVVYYYSITEENAGGEGARSVYDTAFIPAPPAIPTNYSVLSGPAYIKLTWQVLGNGTGSYIYRSTDSGKIFRACDTIQPLMGSLQTQVTIYDTVISPQWYFYKVSAFNAAGESGSTPPDSGRRTAPAMPLNVTAGSDLFTTHIPVSWTASTGAAGYYVYRSDSAAGTYQKIAATAAVFHNDSSAAAGTVYYYKVSSYNVIGESAQSNYVSGRKLNQ